MASEPRPGIFVYKLNKMRTIIRRAPGGGRKRKIPISEVDNVLASKLSVAQLAKHYNVSRDTIYLIFKRKRADALILKSD